MLYMNWLQNRLAIARAREERAIARRIAIEAQLEELMRSREPVKPEYPMPEDTVDISVLNEKQEQSGWQQLPDGRIMYDPRVNGIQEGRLMYPEEPGADGYRVVGQADVETTISSASGQVGFATTQGRGFFGNLTLGPKSPTNGSLVGIAEVNRLVGPGNTHVAMALVANTVKDKPVYFSNVQFELIKE